MIEQRKGYDRALLSILWNLSVYYKTVTIYIVITRVITRGSHSHRTCRTICDRDQNEIKRSRGYLDQNQAIKEGFK